MAHSLRKTYIFNEVVLWAFRRYRTAQEAPKTAPRRPKKLPRGPQDSPRGPQDGPRGAQDGPRGPQDGPKRGPRGGPRTASSSLPPQEAARRPQGGPSRGPRRPPRGPKEAPRSPKSAPKMLRTCFQEAPDRFRGSREATSNSQRAAGRGPPQNHKRVPVFVSFSALWPSSPCPLPCDFR